MEYVWIGNYVVLCCLLQSFIHHYSSDIFLFQYQRNTSNIINSFSNYATDRTLSSTELSFGFSGLKVRL